MNFFQESGINQHFFSTVLKISLSNIGTKLKAKCWNFGQFLRQCFPKQKSQVERD